MTIPTDLAELERVLFRVLNVSKHLKNIMATQSELVTQIKTLSTQVAKIGDESQKSLDMIADLKKQIDAGGTITPELQQAVADLATQLQVVDDKVPDATPTPGTV